MVSLPLQVEEPDPHGKHRFKTEEEMPSVWMDEKE